MGSASYCRDILPDIEMYGGNTDVWEIPLYRDGKERVLYTDAVNYNMTLVIRDFGYAHRPNGDTYVAIEKTGEATLDADGESAIVVFQFDKEDTESLYGKFIYQIVIEAPGYRSSAQGNLLIIKNIDLPIK